MKEQVTDENIRSFASKLEAMKAAGTYDQWREKLRKEAAEFDASPRGRLDRLIRNIQYIWSRLIG